MALGCHLHASLILCLCLCSCHRSFSLHGLHSQPIRKHTRVHVLWLSVQMALVISPGLCFMITMQTSSPVLMGGCLAVGTARLLCPLQVNTCASVLCCPLACAPCCVHTPLAGKIHHAVGYLAYIWGRRREERGRRDPFTAACTHECHAMRQTKHQKRTHCRQSTCPSGLPPPHRLPSTSRSPHRRYLTACPQAR